MFQKQREEPNFWVDLVLNDYHSRGQKHTETIT